MIKTIIKKYTPDFLLVLYDKQIKFVKRSKIKFKKINGKIYTKNDISSALNKVGIKKGDNLLVHCKMSSLGYIDGGAESIIDALCNSINAPEQGTLLMPTFPHHQLAYDYFESNPEFDVQTTPSLMGVVSEKFRTKNGVIRSLHPSHPVSAYGPNADFLVKDHFGQITPFNKNSPFYKLSELNGKILLIGLKMNESLTSVHVIEDIIENFKYPVYLDKIYDVKLVDYSSKSHYVKVKIHNPIYSNKRECDKISYLFDDKIIKEFKICEATCLLFDAKELQKKLIDLYYKGISIYSPYGDLQK